MNHPLISQPLESATFGDLVICGTTDGAPAESDALCIIGAQRNSVDPFRSALIAMPGPTDRFWETTPLADMSPAQWESLCDGCGKCCLEKLEDEDTRQIYYTNVACRLLDHQSCRCKDYLRRARSVPTCLTLTPALLADPYWLPSTCAYRRIAEDKPLPDWHPLLTADPGSVAAAGHSVAGRVIAEGDAGPLVHHLVDWVDLPG